MSFFDDSHVTDVGLRGSAGPSVGFGEMISQSFQQQFRVDSARALDDELRNRWLESLRAAQITNQIAYAPDPLDRNPSVDSGDPWAYRAFAQHVSGQPIDAFDPNRPLFGDYDPTTRIKGMIDANEKIKALNNPNIKTFEQILSEVSQMQQGVEEKTASSYERSKTGGWWASLIGSIGGSFTTRDPLNIITAPIGAGRTVAMRVATDMGVAAVVTGYTELVDVAPARKIVGLPERNPLYNIAAAAIGAGIVRGALIEPVGAGIKYLKSENVNFDLRDSQLAQMFEVNIEKPSARAGLKLLDDTQFIERNNPYGEGRAAQERFMAELQEVQRVMGGEPMTAVARVLPPIPYEQLKKMGDFEIVREQAPEVYARMEAAQVKVAELEERANVSIVGNKEINTLSIKELETKNPHIKTALNVDRGKNTLELIVDEQHYRKSLESSENLRRATLLLEEGSPSRITEERRVVNKEYETAYREVEAEATRINERQTAVEALQRRESASILMPTAEGRPFIGPILQHNYVETLVDRINKFNDALDEQTSARFARQIETDDNKGVTSFKTAKGSEYTVGEGGVTTRNKAFRVEHGPKEQGPQPTSEATYYITTKQAAELGLFQAEGGPKMSIEPLGDGRIGVRYLEGKDVGKFEKRTVITPKLEPKVGLLPVEIWKEGQKVHFGNEIIEVSTQGPEAWKQEGGIDIGLKDPVDPNFRFETDEGEMTVAAAMRDLQDDTDLDEAMRTCLV